MLLPVCTRDGAHVEYFRGLANPIGLKVGTNITADELVCLCGILNPDAEPGKLTLITRYERMGPVVSR